MDDQTKGKLDTIEIGEGLEDIIQLRISPRSRKPTNWKYNRLRGEATIKDGQKFFIRAKAWMQIVDSLKKTCKKSLSGDAVVFFEVKYS